MNWIKKNPAPFALALVSIGSLALVGMLYSRVSTFPDQFSYRPPTPSDKAVPPDLSLVEGASKSLAQPAKWTPAALFVSTQYIAKPPDLINPRSRDLPLHPPIANKWIIENKLQITSPTLLAEDTDADGFSTLDEWNGLDGKSHLILPLGAQRLQPVLGTGNAALPADSTDPNDPKSHPPYHTKIRLLRIEKVPFRLILKSYDGKPEDKAKMTFFVNAVDGGRKTELLAIGGTIASAPRYKLIDFRPKIEKGPDGFEKDKSALILLNTEYQEELVLPLNEIVDSPESFAVLQYLWVAPGGQPAPNLKVKKNGEFTLQPEADKKYKLLKFGDGNVEIQTPAGEKITVPVTR